MQWRSAHSHPRSHTTSCRHSPTTCSRSRGAMGSMGGPEHAGSGAWEASAALASVSAKCWNATVREPTATEPLPQDVPRGSRSMQVRRRSMLGRPRFICQCCCSTCSGVAVSRRTPGFRRHLRGRGKVTLFIEKKGFSEGRGSTSERATNGDPKVAGNISENTVSERIAGIRGIPGI